MTIFFASLTAKSQEVFVPNSKGDLTQLKKAVISGNKTGGKALLAAYGAKLTTSLVLDGKTSNVFLPSTSTVFYIFQPKNLSIQAWKVVPLKSKKKTRELPYMKSGAYSGSKTNIDDIPVISRKLTDEVYELRTFGDMKTGEYAIILVDNGVPALVYDFHTESNLPPYPSVSDDVIMNEFYPATSQNTTYQEETPRSQSTPVIRWYVDSDPRGARIFYRVISNCPNEVKNTNESYMTTTPLEETRTLNIPGLTYENAADVVIEIKLSKRGYEDQVKRYNVRQALDQQEISGFFELVEKENKNK